MPLVRRSPRTAITQSAHVQVTGNRRYNAIADVFYVRESGPEHGRLPSAGQPRLCDVWIPHGIHIFPEAWDLTVTSCLRQQLGAQVGRRQNLAEHENLKRTTRKASVSPKWFLTDTLGAGETQPATSSPGSPNGSAPPPSAHRAASISNWLSAPLRHFTVVGRPVSDDESFATTMMT